MLTLILLLGTAYYLHRRGYKKGLEAGRDIQYAKDVTYYETLWTASEPLPDNDSPLGDQHRC